MANRTRVKTTPRTGTTRPKENQGDFPRSLKRLAPIERYSKMQYEKPMMVATAMGSGEKSIPRDCIARKKAINMILKISAGTMPYKRNSSLLADPDNENTFKWRRLNLT